MAFVIRVKITPQNEITQSGDAVRDKLAELGVSESDIAEAVSWARLSLEVYTPERVSEFEEAEADLKNALEIKFQNSFRS